MRNPEAARHRDRGLLCFRVHGRSSGPDRTWAGLAALLGSLTFGTGDSEAGLLAYDFVDMKRVTVEGEGLFPILVSSAVRVWDFLDG